MPCPCHEIHDSRFTICEPVANRQSSKKSQKYFIAPQALAANALAANNPVFRNPATLLPDAGLPAYSPEGESKLPGDSSLGLRPSLPKVPSGTNASAPAWVAEVALRPLPPPAQRLAAGRSARPKHPCISTARATSVRPLTIRQGFLVPKPHPWPQPHDSAASSRRDASL